MSTPTELTGKESRLILDYKKRAGEAIEQLVQRNIIIPTGERIPYKEFSTRFTGSLTVGTGEAWDRMAGAGFVPRRQGHNLDGLTIDMVEAVITQLFNTSSELTGERGRRNKRLAEQTIREAVSSFLVNWERTHNDD
jgi:hypothetical protein